MSTLAAGRISGMLAQSQLKSPDGQPRAEPRTRLGGARSDLTWQARSCHPRDISQRHLAPLSRSATESEGLP